MLVVNAIDWTVFVFLVALCTWSLTRASSAEAQAEKARCLGRKVGLDVPASMLPAIVERSSRRRRHSMFGAILGVCLVVAVRAGALGSTGISGDTLIMGGAFFVGGALGAALAAMTDPIGRADQRSRVAHARGVTLGDYLAPAELFGARLAVAAAVAAMVGLRILAQSLSLSLNGASWAIAVSMVGLALASLVTFELAGRRIVNRSRPSGSRIELAWDDALRATELRDIVTAPISLAIFAVAMLLLVLGDVVETGGASQTLVNLVDVAPLPVFALVTLLAFQGERTVSQQHYLTALWPEVPREHPEMTS